MAQNLLGKTTPGGSQSQGALRRPPLTPALALTNIIKEPSD